MHINTCTLVKKYFLKSNNSYCILNYLLILTRRKGHETTLKSYNENTMLQHIRSKVIIDDNSFILISFPREDCSYYKRVHHLFQRIHKFIKVFISVSLFICFLKSKA
jgi:hypothetical protein